MFDVRFDRVVSIGDSCGCAMLLREARLRMSSGPFDWITGATLEQHVKTLCGRFQDFLHLENLVWYEAGDNLHANDVYRDSVTGDRFVHDFPKQVPLASSFPAVRAKYERRFNRLLQALDGGESICFIWRSINNAVGDDECLEAAMANLRQAYPRAACRLLIIQNDPRGSRVRPIYRSCASGECVRAQGSFYREGDDVLVGNVSLHMQVFRKLKRSKSFIRQCRRQALIRSVVRFISLWHLDREARKLSRKKWSQRLGHVGGVASVGW